LRGGEEGMNAEQAREISLANANQVAEEQLKEAIKEMEKQIKTSATNGYYEASISVVFSEAWKDNHNTRRFRQHFQEKGFGVEIVEHLKHTSIRCYWF
jgi:hypothetical protein